jgi:hypothetical protein
MGIVFDPNLLRVKNGVSNLDSFVTSASAEGESCAIPARRKGLTMDTTAIDDKVLFHAAGIKTAWNKQVSGIIETGQLLLAAKKALSGTGKWLKLFDPKIGDLPFCEDTAQLLMKIARHPVLSNAEHVRHLPPHWGTLAVLSKATPKQLERWLADGKVNIDTERQQAESLVNPKKPAKAKAAEKDLDDSDKTVADATASNNTSSERKVQEVQECLGHLYDLVCDSRIDWMKVIQVVGSGMARDIVEELTSRLNDHAEAASHEKEWLEAAN